MIFVDNDSLKTELDIILPVLNTLPHKYIKLLKNEGFVKATNIGILNSEAPFIVLMNNDTEAVEGWLDKLVQPLEENHNVGLSGPLTTAQNSWQGRHPKDRKGYMVLEIGMLAFFTTMFKREVLNVIGLLDESFGVGLGDDDDYCQRCLDHGYKMALVQDLIIPYHHRTTFKTLYTEQEIKTMQDKAIKYLKDKHNLK